MEYLLQSLETFSDIGRALPVNEVLGPHIEDLSSLLKEKLYGCGISLRGAYAESGTDAVRTGVPEHPARLGAAARAHSAGSTRSAYGAPRALRHVRY
eukprot:3932188-Rhodomonas_salina.2